MEGQRLPTATRLQSVAGNHLHGPDETEPGPGQEPVDDAHRDRLRLELETRLGRWGVVRRELGGDRRPGRIGVAPGEIETPQARRDARDDERPDHEPTVTRDQRQMGEVTSQQGQVHGRRDHARLDEHHHAAGHAGRERLAGGHADHVVTQQPEAPDDRPRGAVVAAHDHGTRALARRARRRRVEEHGREGLEQREHVLAFAAVGAGEAGQRVDRGAATEEMDEVEGHPLGAIEHDAWVERTELHLVRRTPDLREGGIELG
jgi:hypothetical protein